MTSTGETAILSTTVICPEAATASTKNRLPATNAKISRSDTSAPTFDSAAPPLGLSSFRKSKRRKTSAGLVKRARTRSDFLGRGEQEQSRRESVDSQAISIPG